MRAGITVERVVGAIHAHPTLSKVAEASFRESRFE
jgi:pyruvate/2-oxoglutarate dehydrogenase complex dihydrolipoamide dehydrogenase (E3) component